MNTQSSVRAFRTALFAALGISPLVACGGATKGDGNVAPPPRELVKEPFLACGAAPAGAATPGPGYAACGPGYHRTSKETCSSAPTPPNAACQREGPGCKADADCTEKPNGRCAGPVQLPGCFCDYGCATDADCGTGQVCLCGERFGKCVEATCAVDGDCGPGALCVSYQRMPGCMTLAFACQTKQDDCASDADCKDGKLCGLENGTHRCVAQQCAIGRPFLVAGAPRVADVVRRDDWRSSLSPSVDALTADARATLAASWTEVALMEHASIAAFARFALELVSLGAPPSLVEGAHAAMADETVHARDAFALASDYAGEPLGPGAFAVAAASLSRSPVEIVTTAIVEGCIGETVAALEAAEALAGATDPAVRDALTKVAADEARHATLAWQFVQWVVRENVAELRETALTALQRALHDDVVVPDGVGVPTHGVLDGAQRRAVRVAVLRDVVGPAVRALSATVRSGAPRDARSELRPRL